jgi:hypothetical protein
MFKTMKAISLTAIVLLGVSACDHNGENHNQNNPASQQASSIAAAPAADKGVKVMLDKKLSPNNEMIFNNQNFLIMQENEKFTATSYGLVDTADVDGKGEPKKPAEGEVFHVLTYTSTLSSQAKASITMDGKTTPLTGKFAAEGSILVSAPEQTKITLNIERLGVTQSMDFKTSKRTTEGVAEVWYKSTKATLGNAVVSETFVIQGKNVKLDYSVINATRTAYDAEGKWADDGKSAWVIVDGKKPAWTIPDNGGTKNVNEKFVLRDAAGKEYPVAGEPDKSGGQDLHLEFKVPSNIDAFILKLDSSTDITYFGEVQGTASITSEKVQITFQPTNVSPTATPKPTPSGTVTPTPGATGRPSETSTATGTATPSPTPSPTVSK